MSIVASDAPLWGVDLGGSKIEGAIVDPVQRDRALWRLRVPTESERGYEHISSQISALVERLESESGISRPPLMGFATPGTVEPATGVMKNCNTVALNGRALRDDLAKSLGVEAHLANDANCFALAESLLGAGRGRRVVMGLILGTGVGGGIVVDGRVLEGLHGIAGEWGHNPMRDEHTPCYCGRKGCVETVISGPALERVYCGLTGEPVRLEEIVSRALRGDAAAVTTLERLRSKFGEAIAAVINIIDPDAIVIGGGVGNIDALYDATTYSAVERHLFNPMLRTEFLKPLLGDSAGVFGAALLTSAPAVG
jgi:predicted NBD/HSP70 family sugar kinase